MMYIIYQDYNIKSKRFIGTFVVATVNHNTQSDQVKAGKEGWEHSRETFW